MAAIVERGTGGWRFAAEVEEALPLIAAVITRAENDKLEEAAQCADVAQAEADACSSRVVEEEIVAAAVSGCCGVIAATIRSLKKD